MFLHFFIYINKYITYSWNSTEAVWLKHVKTTNQGQRLSFPSIMKFFAVGLLIQPMLRMWALPSTKKVVNWCWISSIHGAILGGHDCGDRNMNLSCSGSGWFSKLGYPNFIIKNWYRFGMLGSSIFRNPPEVLHNFDPLSFPDHLP